MPPNPPSRAAIVRSAASVFARQGIEATTVADLLGAADVSRRTFYKSFPNKEAVLAALYDAHSEQLLSAIRQMRQRGGPLLEALMAGLAIYLDYHAHSGPLMLVMIEEAGRSGSLLAERRKEMRQALIAFIGDAAEEKTRERPDPLLIIAMLSALEGVSLHLLRSGAIEADALDRAKRVVERMLERLLGDERSAKMA